MKQILVLNFFPAFTPPASGGELRYYNIYLKLSQYYNITLLSPTYNEYKEELVEYSSSFREYRIPKENIHNDIYWELEKENFASEFSALTMAYSGENFNNYHKKYLELYSTSDIIIHDSPYMLHYDLFFSIDNKPRIYHSYNIEYLLMSQIYRGPQAEKHLNYIFNLEKTLCEKSTLVFTCSKEEQIDIAKLYKINISKVKLSPNGITPEDYELRDEKIRRKTAFFIGSGHPPNIEAVNFITQSLATQCSDIEFLIAGSCCDGIKCTQTNVNLLGRITESQKQELFRSCDIAINPMFSGAGTNLKTLEYLSMGIPMISTNVGVRGIDINDKIHFLLATPENFSDQISLLVNDDNLKTSLSHNAKIHINHYFSWSSIAEKVYLEISTLNYQSKKTILLLNDFEVSRPFGGGEVRINRLYSELSKYYKICLICLNNNQIKQTWIKDNFLELSLPKTPEHLNEEILVNSQHWVSATDIVTSYMISKNDILVRAVQVFSPLADITIVTHPYMIDILENINTKYLIHESLNFEYHLKKHLLSSHPQYDMLLQMVYNAESKSCKKSDLIVSVSDDEHQSLRNYLMDANQPIVTIKNGVDLFDNQKNILDFKNIKKIFGDHTIIVFIGSAHMPNIESAKYILNTLSFELKDLYFVIIGTVCDCLSTEHKNDNVFLFGKLEEDYKNALLSVADIAINPMFSGAGSNLKLAEYFSWKLPTITTSFGARGYTINNNQEAIICEVDLFADNIQKLRNDKKLALTLGQKAYEYVKENVQWNVLGKKYRDIIEFQIFKIKRKKLLIVTYRFTIPQLGGAEVYLYELLKALDQLDDFDITVAYLDSYHIQNKYHFSINATRNLDNLHNEFKNITFRKFAYEELYDKEKMLFSKALMNLWMHEFLISARKFTHLYNKTLLLGGWNFPEKQSKNATYIWSSGSSEIYIHESGHLAIKGFSPSKKMVIIKFNNKIIYQHMIKSNFCFDLSLYGEGILSIVCAVESIEEDIRPLGVLVQSIYHNHDNLNLEHNYQEFLKEHHKDLYINELIAQASHRDDSYDAMFQAVRGLNSSELETYLDNNLQEFDIILGHSIPFATTPIVSKYSKKHNKQYALLPHFHFDDVFYHWKSYYQALQDADIVFASPTISIKYFYSKLNIKTIDVPGGGVSRDEYHNIDSEQFFRLYNSDKPFILTLGRKSGAKNYQSIVDAVDAINEHEHKCNLVMIGRDEDNAKITSQYTLYLGEQPREIVLGALKECKCVVTMSESESFGIVIVEAWMLQKTVVVNQNCPAFTELVQDNFNGLFADTYNLKEKLSLILHSQDLEYGKNGYLKVKDYFWDEFAKKINSCLIGLCLRKDKTHC